MIIKPKIRGFICTTAHPEGCAQNIRDQIEYLKNQPSIKEGPKKVLVIGSSTGYGLSSRVVSAFGGSQAATIGVFFEKEAEGKRTASAGWYNSASFEEEAIREGLYAKSFNGDAYSDEMKKKVVAAVKKDLKGLDLIVYSLASPRREHPKTKEVSKSILRPIGGGYTNKSINFATDRLEEVSLPKATQEEIQQTVSVMGGEDWEYWIDALEEEGLINEGARTMAYSYIGPEITKAIYRNGTIGKAKDHLETTAQKLNERFKKINGRALISVNKALVTQSSSAIPFIPLYFILLSKVLQGKNTEENCIQQIYRLFAEHLFSGGEIPVDERGFIRMDNHEMEADVQATVDRHWKELNDENFTQLADLDGLHTDFLKLFGFGVNGVNYNEDVDPHRSIPSI